MVIGKYENSHIQTFIGNGSLKITPLGLEILFRNAKDPDESMLRRHDQEAQQKLGTRSTRER